MESHWKNKLLAGLFVTCISISLLGAGCEASNEPAKVFTSPAPISIERNSAIVTSSVENTQPKTVREAPLVPSSQTAPIPVYVTPAPNGTYTNVDNDTIPKPYAAPTTPAGASALCRDGTYSFSQNRRGTCSHHGGVEEWL